MASSMLTELLVQCSVHGILGFVTWVVPASPTSSVWSVIALRNVRLSQWRESLRESLAALDVAECQLYPQ